MASVQRVFQPLFKRSEIREDSKSLLYVFGKSISYVMNWKTAQAQGQVFSCRWQSDGIQKKTKKKYEWLRKQPALSAWHTVCFSCIVFFFFCLVRDFKTAVSSN